MEANPLKVNSIEKWLHPGKAAETHSFKKSGNIHGHVLPRISSMYSHFDAVTIKEVEKMFPEWGGYVPETVLLYQINSFF